MSKKVFTGTVVSDKMKNTAVIAIERLVAHPRYGKLLKKTRRLLVDTTGVEVRVGEVVKIEEIKPMSKRKNFRVLGKEQNDTTQK